MKRRPMIFRQPPTPEHYGEAIVHLQTCVEELDNRQAELESLIATAKRWSERAVWAAAIIGLSLANLSKEQLADMVVKLVVGLFGR